MIGKIISFVLGFIVGTLFGWKIIAVVMEKLATGGI